MFLIVVDARNDGSSGDKGLVRECFVSTPEICLNPDVVDTDPFLVARWIAEFVVVHDNVGVFDDATENRPRHVARCLDRRVDPTLMCFGEQRGAEIRLECALSTGERYATA